MEACFRIHVRLPKSLASCHRANARCNPTRPGTPRADGAARYSSKRKKKLLSGRPHRTVRLDAATSAEIQVYEKDCKFMQLALLEANKAASMGEVPVGAVLVCGDRLICQAHNLVEQTNDPTAHAEMICIREASRLLGGWRLLDTTIYVTLEPCPMCAGALLQARVGTLVFGAPNPLLGAAGSWIKLLPVGRGPPGHCDSSFDGQGSIIGPRHTFHPGLQVRRGVLEKEAAAIIREFFRRRRAESARSPKLDEGDGTSGK